MINNEIHDILILFILNSYISTILSVSINDIPIQIETNNKFDPSKRSSIESFKVMDVMAKGLLLESQGRDISHMEVGQPSSGAPKEVIDEAIKALTSDKIGYTNALGILPLRNEISKHYYNKYNINISTDNIIITTGSSAAFLFSFLGCFDIDDCIAICSTGYPCYRNIIKALGLHYICIPANKEFKLTSYELINTINYRKNNNLKPLKGLILSSPGNPTGAMLTSQELQDLCNTCKDNNIMFISDEIYHGISYGMKESTAIEFSNQCIVINSFSKYYSMTGWRLGWMVVPDQLISTMNRLSQNMYINAPTLSQIAACKAFSCSNELNRHIEKYSINRKIVLDTLIELGFRQSGISPANGAFYIYVDLTSFPYYKKDLTAPVLCDRLLEEAGVAITPGIDFEDPESGLGLQRIRFSYSRSNEEVRNGMNKFKSWWLENYPQVNNDSN